jgi:hypothetical protein
VVSDKVMPWHDPRDPLEWNCMAGCPALSKGGGISFSTYSQAAIGCPWERGAVHPPWPLLEAALL